MSLAALCAGLNFACTDKPSSQARPLKEGPKRPDAAMPLGVDAAVDSGLTPLKPAFDAGLDASAPRLPSLGINAFSPEVDGDAGALAESDALLGELDLLALKVQATHFSYPIDDLDTQAVAERVARFAAVGVSVAVQLEVVSGRRVTGGAAAVDPTRVMDVVHELFSRSLAADYLFFGSALDAHLNALPKEEREGFQKTISDLMTAAREDELRPPRLRVGYSTGYWAQRKTPQLFREWNRHAEALGVEWFVVGEHLETVDPPSASSSLVALTEAISESGLPLVLQQVAYPSRLRGVSLLASQATFHDGLIETLAGLGERVPFAAISSLDDPSDARCARQAADLGIEEAEAFTEAQCSIGLRAPGFMEKPSYFVALEGLARFSAPSP